MMNIGEAARQSGLNTKTIRYYERIGLVEPQRAANGYRDYRQVEVDQLQFLQRARAVGFSLAQCRELLELYRDPKRRSAEVKALVLERVATLEHQMHELQAMRQTLMEMAERCAGDTQPDCAIIDSLAKPMPFKLV